MSVNTVVAPEVQKTPVAKAGGQELKRSAVMSEAFLVEPDVEFIKEVGKLGGQDLKKCFQCATCSVACTISPDNKPFPRKEMLAASWGLKDRLIADGDIWLCHNCGDCSTRCPRDAKPGDVMGALRAYAVSEYAAPKVLAKAVNDPRKLLPLALLPAVLFLVVGFLINILFGVQWLNFSPGGETIVHGNFFSTWLVDLIFIPTLFFAIAVFALGLKRFVTDMHANALQEGKTDKKSIDPVGFVQALTRTLTNIAKHTRFNQCGQNKERTTPHMMVLFSFIALFIVTNIFFVALYIFGQHGPYSQLNPVKWLANLGGLALIIGSGIMIVQRLSAKDQVNSYKDWLLLGLVFGLGVTGMLAQLTRLGGMAGLSYFIYFVHLMFVFYLFAYTPFSKLAHLVYRTVAMAYTEYSGRK